MLGSRVCLMLVMGAVSALLAGCVSIPQSIGGDQIKPQENLLQVQSNPKYYKGLQARFGGRVVDVHNKNGITRLQLAVQPLDSGARPILGSSVLGRIVADIPGFVDPLELRTKYVTVLGTIDGTVQGKIGDAQYQFVQLKVTGYQRWNIYQQIVTPVYPVADPWLWYGHDWGYPVFNPWPGGYYPMTSVPVQNYLAE